MDLVMHNFAKPQQITTVYLAAEDTFTPAPEVAIKRFREENGLNRPYFVLFGQFEFRKNVPTTLSAIRRAVLDKGSKSQFLIVGSGINAEAMQRELERADLPLETVRFVASPDDETLALAYSGARGTLYVSLGEGFGLPIAESLACGCPSITTAVTSVPEVARDAALYVDPRSPDQIADAIVALERSDSLYAQLSAAALTSAARFSWDRTVEELSDVLCTLARPILAERSMSGDEGIDDPRDSAAAILAMSLRLLLNPSCLTNSKADKEALELNVNYVEQLAETDPLRVHFIKVFDRAKRLQTTVKPYV